MCGVVKMPAPMIPTITTIVASKGPRARWKLIGNRRKTEDGRESTERSSVVRLLSSVFRSCERGADRDCPDTQVRRAVPQLAKVGDRHEARAGVVGLISHDAVELDR